MIFMRICRDNNARHSGTFEDLQTNPRQLCSRFQVDCMQSDEGSTTLNRTGRRIPALIVKYRTRFLLTTSDFDFEIWFARGFVGVFAGSYWGILLLQSSAGLSTASLMGCPQLKGSCKKTFRHPRSKYPSAHPD